MLKKYSIISLFLFAYTIVLAHSIIPHHHHVDHRLEQSSDHHHHDMDHHDNDGEEGLAHEFGNYMHSVNTTDVYQQPDTQNDQNTIAAVYHIISFCFRIKDIEITLPVICFSNDCVSLLQHYLSSKGLRAPPCALV